MGHKSLAKHFGHLSEAVKALSDVTVYFTEQAGKDFSVVALFATQYMELFGDVTVGWLLLWQAVIANERLEEIMKEKGAHPAEDTKRLAGENSEVAFYSGKIASARYFSSNVLSLAPAKARAILRGDTGALEIAEEAF